jgi:hypothetical protein
MKKGDIVRFRGQKAIIKDKFHDGVDTRYIVKYVIGRNEVGDEHSTTKIEEWQ